MTKANLTDVDLRVLLYLHEAPDTEQGKERWLNNALKAIFGNRDDDSAEIVFELIRRDLVRSNGTFAHVLSLTVRGRRAVDDLLARQQDRSYRRQQCRDDLLRWIDAETEPNGDPQVAIADFTGVLDLVPYTASEVSSAASFLHTRGLVVSLGSLAGDHDAMRITEDGRDCVDNGGVRALASPGGRAQSLVVGGSSNTIVAITGDGNDATIGVPVDRAH